MSKCFHTFLTWAIAEFVLALMLSAAAPAQQRYRLEGSVRDASGGVIPGATISFSAPLFQTTTTTSADGRFAFPDLPVPDGVLRIDAPGFESQQQDWTASYGSTVTIVLGLPIVWQHVSVTATRTELPVADSAASVRVFDDDDLHSMGGLTLDSELRTVPGFTLFRRSGSLTANPTSQGVSLRGIGGSGASRALVLYDGVPLNDPFGGWVYWSRVPLVSVSSVEVMQGGASDLYGTQALSGVVNIRSRSRVQDVVSVDAFGGSLGIAQGSVFAARRLREWGVSGTAEGFRSDGYLLVRSQDRGQVDTPAASDHRTGEVSVERLFSGGSRLFLNGTLFSETRNNGTAVQANSTHLGSLVGGAEWSREDAGNIQLRFYATGERFHQTFSSIAPDRNSESLVRSQVVPAQQFGVSSYWTRTVKHSHTLVAGVEVQDTRGHSNEFIYTGGRAVTNADSGGRQRTAGVYGEDVIRLGSNWVITAGARVDHWRNFDAFQNSFPLLGGPANFLKLAERTQTAVSPRFSVLRQMNSHVSVSAAFYRALRAPTLNELYRQFRLGNISTLANSSLTAERLTGGEAGVVANAASGRIGMRATLFWAEVDNPIANVTLSSTPQLIIRQRQNLGLTRSRGVEATTDFRANSRWRFSLSYQFADSVVVSFPSDPKLVGLRLPQVPQHQVSSEVRYESPGWTFAAQPRWVGTQFDDDQNQFPLDSYFTMDAFVSRRLTRNLQVYFAAENVFDQRYMVGRTPTITLGPPLIARGGIRLQFSRR